MPIRQLYDSLISARTIGEAQLAIETFEAANKSYVQWVPVGRLDNNRGPIEVTTDPGRSLVERITNAIDAVIELEHQRHKGMPTCLSPKDAANCWLNVPAGGLSSMSPSQRRQLAQRVAICLLPGDGPESRVVEVRDLGIGLSPEDMPGTILSLNASNKVQKHYLAGVYGQGGSSTFAVSKYTLIASRSELSPNIGFTVVFYLDLPPEDYKTGHYVYLVYNGAVLQTEMPRPDFATGTLVKHFGYDLSSYKSPVGPDSVFGLINTVLFDPIMPVWLENEMQEKRAYRRVIKGSRNSLNGAVDEGDESGRGPELSHHLPMFYVSLGDFGRIGIEYWVLKEPDKENKIPIKAFVNPKKPIILTLHGQNHGELSRSLIVKDADLPYLGQRLICHVKGDTLTRAAQRALIPSNREDARRGIARDLITREIVRALTSDDQLLRLNNEAKDQFRQETDESAKQEMRREVSRILRIYGLNLTEPIGAEAGGQEGKERLAHPSRPRVAAKPIELHEPPSYIRILWDEDKPIAFHPEQRRYMRIETDANSDYHDPNNPMLSRINVITTGKDVSWKGSTPLQEGRMRVILEASSAATLDGRGRVRIELTRPGLPTLSDERNYRIVAKPDTDQAGRAISIPDFSVEPVNGPDDPRWSILAWPDDAGMIASSSQMEDNKLIIYYSTVFPKYANKLSELEKKDIALAHSFTKRYEIWLSVHSLLLYQDQLQTESVDRTPIAGVSDEASADLREQFEREERCRIATLSVLFAAREIQASIAVGEE
jgi:hypothetical protein